MWLYRTMMKNTKTIIIRDSTTIKSRNRCDLLTIEVFVLWKTALHLETGPCSLAHLP